MDFFFPSPLLPLKNDVTLLQQSCQNMTTVLNNPTFQTQRNVCFILAVA